MTEILPCPFCGGVNVSVRDGSTFRWMLAECNECGATAGESRVRTLGEGTTDEWAAQGKIDALEVWNTRAPTKAAAVNDGEGLK